LIKINNIFGKFENKEVMVNNSGIEKFNTWLLSMLPHSILPVQERFYLMAPMEKIGYMMEYLHTNYNVKDFEFIDMNGYEIYDLLCDEIEERGNR